ncbi:hypothetical protein [Falsirhodobacter sp. 20TX0035]|uniref:hypothetical protein n=1 Tax=Falsirhodobacter sp. 20TX0035 TaxID=3022019 RepID=UPI00232DE1A4|nr:hypothetical protein [Falsirhodobacter sp. 20TX0035]MDB6455155.1 hypothetical protein [Falsirhodobacter sp. 20TX0035]
MRWIALLLLAACAPRPDVGPLPPGATAPPVLLPQAEIDARIGRNLTGPSTEDDLDARAAALRARAAALR